MLQRMNVRDLPQKLIAKKQRGLVKLKLLVRHKKLKLLVRHGDLIPKIVRHKKLKLLVRHRDLIPKEQRGFVNLKLLARNFLVRHNKQETVYVSHRRMLLELKRQNASSIKVMLLKSTLLSILKSTPTRPTSFKSTPTRPTRSLLLRLKTTNFKVRSFRLNSTRIKVRSLLLSLNATRFKVRSLLLRLKARGLKPTRVL